MDYLKILHEKPDLADEFDSLLTSSCWMSCPRGMTQKADAPSPYPVWPLPEMAPAENTTCWKMAPSAITAAKGRQAVWPRAWMTFFPACELYLLARLL